jgi:prevent-host-death family protein
MDNAPTNLVGAYDAKTHFSELLERVAAGEQITITRHGTPVARLVPVQPIYSEEQRRAAVVAMRQLASRNRLGGLSVKTLVAEGRPS